MFCHGSTKGYLSVAGAPFPTPTPRRSEQRPPPSPLPQPASQPASASRSSLGLSSTPPLLQPFYCGASVQQRPEDAETAALEGNAAFFVFAERFQSRRSPPRFQLGYYVDNMRRAGGQGELVGEPLLLVAAQTEERLLRECLAAKARRWQFTSPV